MVYCGKPSKGCANCRAKKKKCDQEVPACGLCLRTGVKCPGYRDQLALRFRDQNPYVIRKIQASRTVDVPPVTLLYKPTKVITTDSPATPAREDDSIPLQHFSVTLEDQATCFFFNNHVFIGSASPKTHLDFLPSVYNQEPTSEALSEIIASVGMAGLSRARSSPDIMVAARQHYGTALRLTNAALTDPVQAEKDQTLAVVLLLSLYETATFFSPQSLRSWVNHVDGALTLMSLRSQRRLQDEISLRMFLYLRVQILISCLQRKVAAPHIIVEWSKQIRKFETEDDMLENRLQEIVIRLCSLRASIGDSILTDCDTIVSLALTIEEDLADWVTHLPPEYAYSTITITKSSREVYSNFYHLYPGSWIAHVWNHYRCFRILANEIIVDAISHFPSPLSPGFLSTSYSLQCQTAGSLLLMLASDICASVPSYLGYNIAQQSPAAVSNFLLWPLWVAAGVNYVSHSMRNWVIVQLDKIRDVTGIHQATALANIPKTRKEIRELAERVEEEKEDEDEDEEEV